MDKIDLSNPVMAVAVLSQRIAELEKVMDSVTAEGEDVATKGGWAFENDKLELCACLQKRGALLMAMGDKEGAEKDMQRYFQLNPRKISELNGEFKAEGREHCR